MGDRRSVLRWMAALAWLAIAAGYVVQARARGLSPVEAGDALRSALVDNWWGPALFVLAYVLRPLVFFPASVLTILGGVAFGVGWGVALTVLAANVSMAVSYVVGRFFISEQRLGQLPDVVEQMTDKARSAPFETTLIMRLVYVPFDLVGYVAGSLRLRFGHYALGSFLGTLPGTMAFVGFGASIEELDEGRPSFDLRVLGASVVLALAGVFISRRVGRTRYSTDDRSSGQSGVLR